MTTTTQTLSVTNSHLVEITTDLDLINTLEFAFCHNDKESGVYMIYNQEGIQDVRPWKQYAYKVLDN